MSSLSPMAVPQPWNMVSQAYAEEVVPLLAPFARDALRLVAAPEGARLVDVACGPGTLTFLAAELGHPVQAIDFSPAMIERFEARRLTLGLDTVHARVGDGQDLPYDDGTFAAGFSMFGLMFFPDRARGFAELRRVLVPGARAVVASWHPLEANRVLAAIFAAIRQTMKTLLPDAPVAGSAEMPLGTKEACLAEMSASFADVEVHTITHAQRHESPAAAWASISRTMAPMVLMRRALGDEKWGVLTEAVEATIATQVGPGEIEVSMPAWFTVGVAR